jgi:hypothetical protein
LQLELDLYQGTHKLLPTVVITLLLLVKEEYIRSKLLSRVWLAKPVSDGLKSCAVAKCKINKKNINITDVTDNVFIILLS